MSNHVLGGIEDMLTNAKSAEIDPCSAGTALRDLTDLLAQGKVSSLEVGG